MIDNPLTSNLLTPNAHLSKPLHLRKQQPQFTQLSRTKRISQSKALEKIGKNLVKSVSKLTDKLPKELKSRSTYSPQNFETKKLVPGMKQKTLKEIKRMTHNISACRKVLT